MTSSKRVLAIVGSIVVVLAFVAGGLWLYVGRVGSTGLEQWIGEQIVGILEHHITPQVTFGTIDYQAPYTVVVDDLALSSAGQSLIHVDKMSLELAERPRRGEPIQIKQISLSEPRMQFVAAPSGGFVGWSNFVRSDVMANLNAPPEQVRLSSVLVLRHVAIHDGQIVYKAAPGGDSDAMVLPGINLDLDTLPVADEPGWYALKGTFERKQLFHVALDGQVNLDTALLRLVKLSLDSSLGEEQYETLPPQIQELLRRHEVEGTLTANVRGEIPLKHPEDATGEVQAEIADGRFAYGGAVVPVDRIRLAARLPDNGIELTISNAALRMQDATVATVKRIVLSAADVPMGGKPLHISKIAIEQPSAALTAGGTAGALAPQASSRSTGSAAVPRSIKPTIDRFGRSVRIDEITVNDGAISVGPDDQPLRIGGIDIALQTSLDSNGIAANGTVACAPLVSGDLKAHLAVDTLVARIEKLKLHATVDENSIRQLPDEVRDSIADHRVHGDVALNLHGDLPLRSPANFRGEIAVDVSTAGASLAGIDWPVTQLHLQANLPDGALQLRGKGVQGKVGKETILSIDQLQVEAAGLPLTGGAMEIARLDVSAPVLRLIETETGEFVGWSALFGNSADSRRAPSRKRGHESAPAWGLDKFVLHDVELHDGKVVYRPNGAADAMILPGIALSVKMPPLDGEAGWHKLDVHLRQEPLLDVQADGRVNLNSAVLDLASAQVTADLNAAQYEKLPPQAQGFLRAHEVRGQLSMSMDGKIPLKDPRSARGKARIKLNNARIALEDTVWPAQHIDVDIDATERNTRLDLDGQLLQGELEVHATMQDKPRRPVHAEWRINGIRIEDALRVAGEARPQYAGRVHSTGSLSAELGDLPGSLSGKGHVSVSDGRLMNIPVIHHIVEILAKARLGLDMGNSDSGKMTFSLQPDRVEVSNAAVTCRLVSIQGRGEIFYDKRLDLTVQASILDSLRSRMGRLGDILESIGNKAVGYEVLGTIAEPKLIVKPLGIRLGRDRKDDKAGK